MHTNITLFTLLFSNSNKGGISAIYVIFLHCFIAEVVPSFTPAAAAGVLVEFGHFCLLLPSLEQGQVHSSS